MYFVVDSWKINDLLALCKCIHLKFCNQIWCNDPYPQFSYLYGDGPSLWQYSDTCYRRFPSQSYCAASSHKGFPSEHRTELSYTARNPLHSASHQSHKTSVNSRAQWTAESKCTSRSDTDACDSGGTLSQLQESRPAALATPRHSWFYRSATWSWDLPSGTQRGVELPPRHADWVDVSARTDRDGTAESCLGSPEKRKRWTRGRWWWSSPCIGDRSLQTDSWKLEEKKITQLYREIMMVY